MTIQKLGSSSAEDAGTLLLSASLRMTDKPNIHAIPNKERDIIQEAMADLAKIMPQQAKTAMIMRDGFIAGGFTEDEALKLTAYAIFK